MDLRQRSAKNCREQVQKIWALFDHLVGSQQHRRWDCEAERLCGLEVKHELEFGWSFDWGRCGIATKQDSSGHETFMPDNAQKIRPVRHQSAVASKFAK